MPIFTTTITGSSYTSSISNAVGFVGTASSAVSASYVLPVGLPGGTISSSTQQVVSTYTNATDNRVLTSTGAGGINAELTLTYDGTLLAISTNNAKYLRGGDDAAFWDINVANTVGVYGEQDSTVGAIKLGSSGPTLYGSSSGFFGIGTTTPSALLQVQGVVSASSVSASGDVAAGVNLISNFSSGNEGGQVELAKPQTNSSISGSMVIDVFQNRVRIFEKDSPNRGGYWDITSLASGVGTNFAGGAGTVTSITAGNGLTGGTITGAGTITLDTSSTHFTDGVKTKLNTDGVISSSTQFRTITSPFTGSFTGSFAGTHTGTFPYSSLTGTPTGIVSSSTQVTALLPTGTVSSSGQVSYTGLSNIPVGIVSSSGQVTSLLPTGTVSSSGQVSYTGLSNTPVGIVSSSTQFRTITNPFTGSFTGSFTGTHTGTFPYASLTGIPTGIVSSSTQVTSLLPTGTVSSSGQVSYTGLSNIPVGIVSSSTQFTSITAPFTGSFTGSFRGTLTGTGSWANSASVAISSSFATSASWAPAVSTVGPGTVNSIALFNASSTVSSSNIFQSSANIGIGVVSPSNNLQIQGNVSASSYTSSISNAVGYFGTASWAVSASKSVSTERIDVLGGGSTSATGIYSGSFSGSFFGNTMTGGTANYIPLWTSATAQSSSVIYQSSANIGIGTISPSVRLDVSGSQRITSGSLGVNVAPNATVGRIDASNDIVAFSSDRRLKTNVQSITNSLDKVETLSGFTYNWNVLANALAGYDTSSRYIGVYAQEVQSILPEAVKLAPFDNDGTDKSISGENYLTVQYEKLVPLLIEAIKELKIEVDELKRKIK